MCSRAARYVEYTYVCVCVSDKNKSHNSVSLYKPGMTTAGPLLVLEADVRGRK